MCYPSGEPYEGNFPTSDDQIQWTFFDSLVGDIFAYENPIGVTICVQLDSASVSNMRILLAAVLGELNAYGYDEDRITQGWRRDSEGNALKEWVFMDHDEQIQLRVRPDLLTVQQAIEIIERIRDTYAYEMKESAAE